MMMVVVVVEMVVVITTRVWHTPQGKISGLCRLNVLQYKKYLSTSIVYFVMCCKTY
jgi:hypothetical protein